MCSGARAGGGAGGGDQDARMRTTSYNEVKIQQGVCMERCARASRPRSKLVLRRLLNETTTEGERVLGLVAHARIQVDAHGRDLAKRLLC